MLLLLYGCSDDEDKVQYTYDYYYLEYVLDNFYFYLLLLTVGFYYNSYDLYDYMGDFYYLLWIFK